MINHQVILQPLHVFLSVVRPPELVGGYLNVVPPNRLFCDVTHFGQLIEAALQHECVVIVAGRRGLPTYAELAYAELIPQMINQPMYETFLCIS